MAKRRPSADEVAARTLAIVEACRKLNAAVTPSPLHAEYIAAAIHADAIAGVVEMLDENAIEIFAHLDTMGERIERIAGHLDNIDTRLLNIRDKNER